MRILIVDNYDSFTFNLFQLAARVSRNEPLVVRNDQIDATDIDALGCDCIILSPGPGRPERAADFGVSARVLDNPRVPVLGVCLGHQGIAHHFGGTVTHAREPMHGRTSRIDHLGTGLFEGVPQRFEVVRYHSLVVAEPLPSCLEPTAWTRDGILMGLRHKELPIWGVQFHPESVSSEFGERLLLNFVAMARPREIGQWTESKRRISVVPRALETSEPPPAFSVRTRTLEGDVAPDLVFEALFASEPKAFWLDSSDGDAARSRFTFMGAPHGPHAQHVSYRTVEKRLTVTRNGRTEERREDIFTYLDEQVREHRVVRGDLPFDFPAGFVGYFGYELKSDCGGDVRHRSEHPDAQFVLADRLVAFDRESHSVYLLGLTNDTPDDVAAVEAWFDAAAEALRAAQRGERISSRLDVRSLRPVELAWGRDRARYIADIEQSLEEIRNGETYEVCITNTLHGTTSIDPLDFYRTLRRTNPAPFSAFMRLAGVSVACSSPECFLRIDEERIVTTKPIKGTAPRGATAEADAQAASELARSEKTRSENLMITDLLRNDLGIVCDIGSVHVPHLMAVETYATVHQLVSTIQGRLRAGISQLECVRASFPGGSMTGAPKVRTMRIIDELETEARGIYSGAIGYLSFTGAVNLNIVIRTAVFSEGRVSIGVGGAIVALSDADEEYDEMVLKARALIRALLLANGESDVEGCLEAIERQLRVDASPTAERAIA